MPLPLKQKICNDTERSRNARGIEEMGYDPFLSTQVSVHDQFTQGPRETGHDTVPDH